MSRSQASGRARARRSGPAGRRWLLALAALAVLIAGGLLLRTTQGASPPAPSTRDFTFMLYQGEEVIGFSEGSFSQLFGRGKPVVLNFWAGLCPPCRAEMPAFERVWQEHQGEFILFGLDVGPYTGLGSREDGIALMRELAVTYPTGTTEQARVVRDYQIRGMPTTVFLTQDGRIVSQHTGLLTEEQLRQRVEELIALARR